MVNENGKPMEGASIKVKGTSFYTKTDQNGKFVIPGQYANEMLEIRHLGFSPIEISAVRARVVSLKMTSSDLEDIMVNTGYQQIDSHSQPVPLPAKRWKNFLHPV